MRQLQAVVAILASMVLAACGGGGGPPPTFQVPGRLAGDYAFAAFQAAPGALDAGIASWGAATSDGIGELTGTFDQNAGGNLGGPYPFATPTTYTVAQDGALQVDFSTTSQWRGGVAADGRLAIAGIRTAAGLPSVFALARRSGTFSTASLAGVYHVGLIAIDGSGTAGTWYAATATFDGAGGVAVAATVNADGATIPGYADVGTYAVAADGALTWTFGFGDVGTGRVLEGGGAAVLSGATQPSGDPFLAVLVRASAGADASAWTGTYHAIEIARSASGGFTSGDGRVTADGAGAHGRQLVRNDGTSLTVEAPSAGTYTVAADGRLTASGTDTTIGAVSEDGRVGFLAGPDGAGVPPRLLLFVR